MEDNIFSSSYIKKIKPKLDTGKKEAQRMRELEGGTITVQSSSFLDDLIRDAEENKSNYSTQEMKKVSSHKSKNKRDSKSRIKKYHEINHSEYEKHQKEEEEKFHKAVEISKARKEAKFQTDLDKISEGQEFIKNLEKELKSIEIQQKKKREKLYKEWINQVYDPIQNQVDSHMSNFDSDEIAKRREKVFQRFFEKSDTKLFLGKNSRPPTTADIMHFHYKVEESNDPIKKALIKNEIENSLCSKPNINMHFPREMLSTKLWDKLESTPHGRYALMMSKNEQDASKLKSNIIFDHYNYPRGPEEMFKELGKQVPQYIYEEDSDYSDE